MFTDARDSDDYAESHIITAKLAPRMEVRSYWFRTYLDVQVNQNRKAKQYSAQMSAWIFRQNTRTH